MGDESPRVADRVAAGLRLRPGETGAVGLAFAFAFLASLPLALTASAANALFLAHHDAASLPYAYVVTAVALPTAGWLLLRVERRSGLTRFLLTVGVVVLAGELGLRLALALLDPWTATLALPVWTELEYALVNLQLWSLAGRLFNVQQAKRLFGLIGSGGLLSTGIAGLLTPVLVAAAGTANLLLLSALATLAALGVLLRAVRAHADRLGGGGEDERGHGEGAGEGEGTASGSAEVRAYVRGTYLLIALSFASYYVVERLFYDRAEARFADPDELASFVGVLFGGCALVGLVFRAWLSAWLLARFGLRVGLVALPALLLAAAGGAVAASAAGAATVLFAVVALTRAVDRVLRESLDQQAVLLLYQALPPALRVAAQGMAESVLGPLAGGTTGLLLVGLGAAGVEAGGLSALSAAVALAWCVVAALQQRGYRVVLEGALAGRQLSQRAALRDDPALRQTLARALRSPHAGEAVYAADLLEEAAPDAVPDALRALLAHPAPEARREGLLRVVRLHVAALLPEVEALARDDPVPEVRATALQVVAEDPDHLERVLPLLGEARGDALRALLVGLLRSGTVDGIVPAAARTAQLVASPAVADRLFAARVLGDVGAAGLFYRPVVELLGDPDLRVRRAALLACGRLRSARLWPRVADAFRERPVRAAAAAALVQGGEAVVPLLAALTAPGETADGATRARAAHVLGRLGGPRALRLLLAQLDDRDEGVLGAALVALVVGRHWRPAGRDDVARVEGLLRSTVGGAAGVLAARLDVAAPPADELLVRALEHELSELRLRALRLLALLYEARAVLRAKASYLSGSADRRALALELLDNLLSQAHKALVLPLLDDLPPREALARLDPAGREPLLGRERRLAALLDRPVTAATDWTTACALRAACAPGAASSGAPDFVRARARALAESDDGLVRETARWVLAAAEGRGSREGMMLPTIERVLVLRSVRIFAETPEDVLAEVARIVHEVEVPAGGEVIRKGELGDCLYVVVAGSVKVHDGERVLTTLGERDIVGELAVLDPEPRSASVTALVPTRLFRLDGEELYEIMADRAEILRGVIRVLCRRLRDTGAAGGGTGPGSGSPGAGA